MKVSLLLLYFNSNDKITFIVDDFKPQVKSGWGASGAGSN